MQPTPRKTESKTKHEKKDEIPTTSRKIQDEKLKKSNSVATPRNYIQKSSTTDIYGQAKKNVIQTAKTPKKLPGTSRVKDVSPMKDLLKSSPSSVSVKSFRSINEKRTPAPLHSARSIPDKTVIKKRTEANASTDSAKRNETPRTAKDLPFTNVTVNSPTARRKLDLSVESDENRNKNKIEHRKAAAKSSHVVGTKEMVVAREGTKEMIVARQRTKTRTLEESEVKVLTAKVPPENNADMWNFSDRLAAKPKAFFVDLEPEQNKSQPSINKSSDEEYSYEDDFESYESDFESYHSEETKAESGGSSGQEEESSKSNENDGSVKKEKDEEKKLDSGEFQSYHSDEMKAESEGSSGQDEESSKSNENDGSVKKEKDEEKKLDSGEFQSYHSDEMKAESEGSSGQDEESSKSNENDGTVKKEKDEEKKLDSGSFDLRESQRSGNRKPVVMANIIEDTEDTGEEKKSSFTDEGFQEMSSSAVSSLKTVQETLDRPLFIDFSKSKESRRKRRLHEQLKQRAEDLLSMITLHEMPYFLFEMKPIPYDLYMATFGRSNYTQIAVQTFDDGVTTEVQTEEVLCDCKWTQHPVEFSSEDVYLKADDSSQKVASKDEDYLKKFTFLVSKNHEVNSVNKINADKDYDKNPLRIFLEQKEGVGSGEMLPYENYISKVKNNDYNANKLRKFLKKVENRICHVLNKNAGDAEMTDLIRTSKLPFSKGFASLSLTNLTEEKFSFLKNVAITGLVYSQDKNYIIMTIHKKSSTNVVAEKCILCLWDVSVVRRDPVKILIAIDNVNLGRLRGSTDGIFVAALQDGSMHLWDLSEEPTWRNDVASDEKTSKIIEINSKKLTQTEIDREWNLKNSHIGRGEPVLKFALQACAYTSSAANMIINDVTDYVVGLEFVGNARASGQDGGRKFIGQICSLNQSGALTIWSIIQERSKSATPDLGKAFWSKLKLEKSQTISLADYLDIPTTDIVENSELFSFNLNSAKRRLSNRKQERLMLKKENIRPKSAVSSEFDYDIDRPTSAASLKKVLPVEKNVPQSWENGIVCCDLKIMNLDKIDNYLIAKNCGEVVCCRRTAGAVKISRFCVTRDTSSVTCIEVSPHGLPYFLAATDSGTINLCSLIEARVLLTLDCRNVPPLETVERCQSDNKGRYIGSALVRSPAHSYSGETGMGDKISISSIHWSRANPCCIHTVGKAASDQLLSVAEWDLTHSDICAKSVSVGVAQNVATSSNSMALLTPDGEVQVHRLSTDQGSNNYLDVFKKYVTLL